MIVRSYRQGFLKSIVILELLALAVGARTGKPKCEVCNDISRKFWEGLKKTAKSNFGGGNTRWEEKSLGSYQFSETRLIEITEGLCEDSDSDCHNFMEQWEEKMEEWWFGHFAKGKDTNLHEYFCIQLTKVCCHDNSYGPDCEPCPGSAARPCKGNGKCNGAGTRAGTGKCDCNEEYDGDLCEECKEGYFEEFRNETHVTCLGCDEACDGGCHKGGRTGCHDCKKGWKQVSDDSCEDIDECAEDAEQTLCGENKYCSNTQGSYTCEECNSGCLNCRGPGADKCVECKPTHYHEDDICKLCDQSCEESCSGSGPHACDSCKTGYILVEGEGCKDVNECNREEPVCADDEHCTNTRGSYYCLKCDKACKTCKGGGNTLCTQCAHGYQMNGEPSTCEDIDECLGEEKVCTGEHEKCVNTIGSNSCVCKKGYGRRGNKCELRKKVSPSYSREACEVCTGIVDKFKEGLKKTDKQNFGGGNTQWEEKQLGNYAYSETRLVEISEGVCDDSDKDCYKMMEASEKILEQWWFKQFAEQRDTDLHTYFCVNRVEACCPKGTFGKSCTECQGGKENPCSGNGKCDGEGTRDGGGACSCSEGYSGDTCDQCEKNHYEERNSTHLLCHECDESCEDGCWTGSPTGCKECKAGWSKDEEIGCHDNDECAAEESPCQENQHCVNNPGSFSCEACSSACKGCSGPGNDRCLDCSEHYFLDSDRCIECHEACVRCTTGGQRDCTECRDGWIYKEGEGCVDVNECESEEYPCKSDEYCVNSLGSYLCHGCHTACQGCTGAGNDNCKACAVGFKEGEGVCADVDECATSEACKGMGEICTNSVGSFKCDCDSGYTKKDGICTKRKKDPAKTKPKQTKTIQGSGRAGSSKSQTPGLKRKRKTKKKDQSLDHLKYLASLLGYALVGYFLRKSWAAQLVFSCTFWIYIYWFSLRFEKSTKPMRFTM